MCASRTVALAACGRASPRARGLLYNARGVAECPLVSHVGDSGRLNNTRQVPAPRAFVSDQTGLVEERRDACDLSHLCCFASGTQGSGGALTRHRLVHGARSSCSCVLRCFQRSYSELVASACARVVTRVTRRLTRSSTHVVRAGEHRWAVVRLTVQADAGDVQNPTSECDWDLHIPAVKDARGGEAGYTYPQIEDGTKVTRARSCSRDHATSARSSRGMWTSKARADAEPHKRVTGVGPHTAKSLPYVPKVGAVCGKAASTDLRGGREATRVPTATLISAQMRLPGSAAALFSKSHTWDAGEVLPPHRHLIAYLFASLSHWVCASSAAWVAFSMCPRMRCFNPCTCGLSSSRSTSA